MHASIIPLGTASAIPTRDRHLSATALQREGRVLLFDCGEGTQLQLLRAGLSPVRIDAVLITHLHGDHLFGLFGLLATLGLLDRTEPLTVAGPRGLGEVVRGVPGLAEGDLPFAVRFAERTEEEPSGVVFETADYVVTAEPVDHRVFTLGYRYAARPRPGHLDVERARALGVTDYAHYRALKAGEAVTLADGTVVRPETVVGPEQPGAVFAYVTDTRPCDAGRRLAAGADVLYHEATFAEAFRARAVETGHATAREAAEVAQAAGARRLLLGHFSARHTDTAPLVDEARRVFQNTEAAQELKRYALAPTAPPPPPNA